MGFTKAVAIITGAFIRTAVIGERIELNGPAYPNELVFYTGHPDEIAPARLSPNGGGTNTGYLELSSPHLSTGNVATILLESHEPLPTATSGIEIDCDDLDITTDTTQMIADPFRVGDGADWLNIGSNNGVWSAYLDPPNNEFTQPTLLNSWVDFGGAFQLVGYRLDPDGYVTLRGLVKSGTAANAVMFQLEPGLRPLGLGHTQTSTANDALCRIFVSTSGNVNAVIGGSTTWTSLNGVRFPVF